MRKRIFIGLAVLAVIGVAGYVLSQPKKGTVEWHKGEYLRIERGGLCQKLLRRAPFGIGPVYSERLVRKSNSHYEALLELGYFEDNTFFVTNRSFGFRSPFFDLLPYFTGVEDKLIGIVRFSSNWVTISAPADDMDEVERAVRRFDVPKK